MAHDEIRPGEKAVDWPGAADASLVFIGRIRTPWAERADCPRQGSPDGPVCQIEIFEPWHDALTGIKPGDRLDVLYWLDGARRDLVLQSPRGGGGARGTFALRSPVRPNPIGVSQVTLVAIDGATLSVRGLDSADGTPLIDLKPERCHHGPGGG